MCDATRACGADVSVTSPAPDGMILMLDAAPSPGVMLDSCHAQLPRVAGNHPLPLFATILVIDTVVAMVCPLSTRC